MKTVSRSTALLLTGFVLGAVGTVSAQENETLYRKLEVLAEVLGEIESNYVDKISATQLIYGAAKGAASKLDEHSEFFTPDEFAALQATTQGEYAGIGTEIMLRGSDLVLTSVYPDSPAKQAGLRTGDQLVSIDGAPVAQLDSVEALRRLRGPVGSKVVVEVSRKTRDEPWKFTLVRGWIRVAPFAAEELDGGIRYIKLKAFSSRASIDVEAELKRDRPKRGLILDLRGNPGGLFDEAVAVCDLFISSGPVVSVLGRAGRKLEQHEARPERTLSNFPIAVLIDRASASAAEIVAGCLKDRGRARLFGDRSYGKGSVQNILDLSDGSGLKLTIARYVTPSGAEIDGRGIEPDEKIAEGDLMAPIHRAVTWIEEQ